MSLQTSVTTVVCPVCKRAVAWSDEFPFRPFCSERCKLIDLGAWAAEEHKISEALNPGDDAGDTSSYH